jgi:hypothetical protein
MQVYTGVVARVTLFDGPKIVGDDLRFVPLQIGEEMVVGGSYRLRVTRSKNGTVDPTIREHALDEFEGHMVCAVAVSHDHEWIYGCSDIQGRQP